MKTKQINKIVKARANMIVMHRGIETKIKKNQIGFITEKHLQDKYLVVEFDNGTGIFSISKKTVIDVPFNKLLRKA